jgi:hypothetical protein
MKSPATRREFLKYATFLLGTSLFSSRTASTAPEFDAEKFTFTQLIYRGGNWNPYRNSSKELMYELMRRTSVEANIERNNVRLTDKALFMSPFLYMTGGQEFEPFTDQEIEILRRFLNFGGFLLIDDNLGHKNYGFDKSVRRELARIFPDNPLTTLPADHTVFRSFYLLKAIGGRNLVNPYLEGIYVDDLTPVIYCQNDLGGAWERDDLGNWVYECQPGGEHQRALAFRLGINLILYALTTDYKKDQIHLPAILKRIQ